MSESDGNDGPRLNKRGDARGMTEGSKTGQARKGETSKNPGGRPRGALNRSTRLAMIREVLGKMVIGNVDGKKKKITLTEGILWKLAQQALGGDKQAMGMILKLWEQSEEDFERERETVYPFDENDRKMIDNTYKRMMDCLDPFE